jgi:hypothetical protein
MVNSIDYFVKVQINTICYFANALISKIKF